MWGQHTQTIGRAIEKEKDRIRENMMEMGNIGHCKKKWLLWINMRELAEGV